MHLFICTRRPPIPKTHHCKGFLFALFSFSVFGITYDLKKKAIYDLLIGFHLSLNRFLKSFFIQHLSLISNLKHDSLTLLRNHLERQALLKSRPFQRFIMII